MPALRGPGTYTVEVSSRSHEDDSLNSILWQVTTARIAGAESDTAVEIVLVGTKGKSKAVLVRPQPMEYGS